MKDFSKLFPLFIIHRADEMDSVQFNNVLISFSCPKT